MRRAMLLVLMCMVFITTVVSVNASAGEWKQRVYRGRLSNGYKMAVGLVLREGEASATPPGPSSGSTCRATTAPSRPGSSASPDEARTPLPSRRSTWSLGDARRPSHVHGRRRLVHRVGHPGRSRSPCSPDEQAQLCAIGALTWAVESNRASGRDARAGRASPRVVRSHRDGTRLVLSTDRATPPSSLAESFAIGRTGPRERSLARAHGPAPRLIFNATVARGPLFELPRRPRRARPNRSTPCTWTAVRRALPAPAGAQTSSAAPTRRRRRRWVPPELAPGGGSDLRRAAPGRLPFRPVPTSSGRLSAGAQPLVLRGAIPTAKDIRVTTWRPSVRGPRRGDTDRAVLESSDNDRSSAALPFRYFTERCRRGRDGIDDRRRERERPRLRGLRLRMEHAVPGMFVTESTLGVPSCAIRRPARRPRRPDR